MKLAKRVALAAGLVLVASGALAGPANAASAASSGAARVCVTEATELGSRVPPAPTRCFATFPQAIAFATGGGVVLSPGTLTLEQTDLDSARRSGRLMSTVIGIEYEDANFGSGGLPPHIVSVGISTGCAAGHSFGYLSMPAGWDNRVSSARTYESCKGRHHEYTSYGGSSKLCGCATMGVMDAQTSSIRWSLTG